MGAVSSRFWPRYRPVILSLFQLPRFISFTRVMQKLETELGGKSWRIRHLCYRSSQAVTNLVRLPLPKTDHHPCKD